MFVIYLIGTREVAKIPFLSVLNNFCDMKVCVRIIAIRVSFRRAFLGLVSDAFSLAFNTQPESEATEKPARSVRDTVFWIVK